MMKKWTMSMIISDHQNYYGIDETLGPVAISIRKEKVEDRENNLGKPEYGQNHYRVIFRTSEVRFSVKHIISLTAQFTFCFQ